MVGACGTRKKVSTTTNKRMNQEDLAESRQMSFNRWLDLPSGIFEQIFFKLHLIEMLFIIPLVCKSWGYIILKAIFDKEDTNCLDLSALEDEPFYSYFFYVEDEDSRAMKLMSLLVRLMHAFASDDPNDVNNCAIKTTPITKLLFPPGLSLNDRHLIYLAERCPKLKFLYLPCAQHITGKGMSRAMRCWRGIETMCYAPLVNIPPHLHLPRIVEEIGKNCKNLGYINLGWLDLNWQTAEVLVQNLKSIRKLSLERGCISKYGLQIFLSRCKKNISIMFISCSFRYSQGINYPSTIRVMGIPEGRRIRWWTDLHPHRSEELHTSKGLVSLFWERQE
ncbi:hypothetical protein DCAR_0729260 [Daucus carota subsp. sativus]|uniref:F-box domain-containing protein n=1 Tax=Daucus carota subsp. sativus TaxID=79200 RepID=A0AAF1BAZ8_DAUCS|nr:hypothetical protein DCAR_0729260 [Daucus carota subsp. sativus]